MLHGNDLPRFTCVHTICTPAGSHPLTHTDLLSPNTPGPPFDSGHLVHFSCNTCPPVSSKASPSRSGSQTMAPTRWGQTRDAWPLVLRPILTRRSRGAPCGSTYSAPDGKAGCFQTLLWQRALKIFY